MSSLIKMLSPAFERREKAEFAGIAWTATKDSYMVAVHGFQVSVFPAGCGIQEGKWLRFQTCKHPIGPKLQSLNPELGESGDD